MSLHDTFQDYLSQRNLRYTAQKRAIVSAILDSANYFEIDTFISERYTNGEHLARATVYRTIKQLLDANLIQKINASNGRVYYECNESLNHHDHIICNACGKIMEIKNPAIELALKSECHAIGFTIEYRSVHIYGRCNDCHND
jgi:Fur family ferric uptake transcriptional regulator